MLSTQGRAHERSPRDQLVRCTRHQLVRCAWRDTPGGSSRRPNRAVQLMSVTGNYDQAADPYSMFNTTAATGAPSFWAKGFTGNGVDVAVIDSGVAPVPGLDAPNKVLYGPDLSSQANDPE